MKYKLNNSDEVDYFWVGLFQALSTQQFKKFTQMLKFPLEVTAELNQISKDFVLTCFTYYKLPTGLPPSEKPSMELCVNPHPLAPDIQAWNNTFLRLEAAGYADAIYQWATDIHQLTDSEKKFLSTTGWDLVLYDWAHDPLDPEILPLNLPFKVAGKLQFMIREYHWRYMQMRLQIKQVEQTVSDPWEGFIFNTIPTGSWIYLAIDTLLHLEKWKMITSSLSVEELAIVDQWGYANQVDDYFSLISLAQRLKSM